MHFHRLISNFLQKNQGSSISQEIQIAMIHASEDEIRLLFQHFWIAIDCKVVCKLFTLLTICVLHKKGHVGVFLQNPFVFTKISLLLGNNTQTICIENALQLLFALLHSEIDSTEDRYTTKQLRILLRECGCLQAISMLFLMYKNSLNPSDTCLLTVKCISGACKEDLQNQSNCSHLIPTCLKKVKTSNQSEYVDLIHSLVEGHSENKLLFLQHGGMSIFEPEKLGTWCEYVQLLAELVDHNNGIAQEAFKLELPKALAKNINMYGDRSEIGLWSSIALHHLTEALQVKVAVAAEPTTSKAISIGRSKLNFDESKCLRDMVHSELKVMIQNNQNECYGDDKFQQICKQSEVDKYNSALKKNICQNAKTINFDEKEPFYKQSNKHLSTTAKRSHTFKLTQDSQRNNSKASSNHPKVDSQTANIAETTLNMSRFQPQFVSTPKRNHSTAGRSKYSSRNSCDNCNNSNRNQTRFSSINKSRIGRKYTKNESLMKHSFSITKQMSKPNVNGSNILANDQLNESISSRIYKSLSNSRLIRGFKNMLSTTVASNKAGRTIEISDESEKCESCNDSVSMLNKLKKDEYLKETIILLKRGLIIYGCNFKKISKAFWPDNPQMTPSKLYHLYTKLIVKRNDNTFYTK